MKSETLSMKTITNELDLLKKAVIIPWNIWKKDLLLLETKLIEKIVDPCNGKGYYHSYLEKKLHKVSKTIKNNYSAGKTYRKPKHCWHKIVYYRTSKNFT